MKAVTSAARSTPRESVPTTGLECCAGLETLDETPGPMPVITYAAATRSLVLSLAAIEVHHAAMPTENMHSSPASSLAASSAVLGWVPRQLHRSPALDGLRGLAIVAVVLFHLPTRDVISRGGLFGVDVFFALSGFLITALLQREYVATGTVRVGAFVVGRIVKIAPALLVFLAAYLFLDLKFGDTSWFGSDPFGPRQGAPVSPDLAMQGVVGAATLTFNVLRIAGIALPPIGHLWSLSVEGQFYLVWPPLFVLLMRRAPTAAIPVTAALWAASVVWPHVVWRDGAGADAIYFGSLARLQDFMIGALGFQLWSAGATDRVGRTAWSVIAGCAGAVLIGLVLVVADVPFKYLGASPIAAVAATGLMLRYANASGASPSERLLGSRPLTWLGERSYSIYLWHYLFVSWTNPLPRLIGVPLAIVCALVVGEISWRTLEATTSRR
ncbi:MAG: acyltransferase [Chloroflexota bacterium]